MQTENQNISAPGVSWRKTPEEILKRWNLELLGGGCGGKLGRRREGLGERCETTVLFARFLYHAAGNEILKLFVGAEPKHLLATTGGVAGAQAFVDDVEELFELKAGALLGQGGHQFFGHEVRKTARERTFSLHKHEVPAYHTGGLVSCENLQTLVPLAFDEIFLPFRKLLFEKFSVRARQAVAQLPLKIHG